MKHSRRSIHVAWILLAACLSTSLLSAADTLPRQLADAEFWKIIETFSEPNGVFISENLVSNEVGFPEIMPMLRNRVKVGGVYLGVGPEQNFTYIAAVRPKIAFIADIRRQNVMEHLIYKALFEMSSDRVDFVSRLFSRRRPPGLSAESTVLEIFRGYADAPVDIDASRKTLSEIEDLLLNKHHFGLTVEDRFSIEHVYQSFRNFGPEITYDSGLAGGVPGNQMRPSYFEVMTSVSTNGKQWSYLGNEANYQFVRDLEQRNLIVPVTGDFGGPQTLRAIARYLKQHNAMLNAFYVSNVEQYLFQDATARGANFSRAGITNGGATTFYKNVAEMPVDDASIFIRSIPGGAPLRVTLASIRDTLTAVGNGRIRSYSDLFGDRGRGQFGGFPTRVFPRGYPQFRNPAGIGGPTIRRFPDSQPADERLLFTAVIVIFGIGLGIPYVLRYAFPARPLPFLISALTGGLLGALGHAALAYLKDAAVSGGMLAAPSFGVALAAFLILNRGRQEPRPQFRRNQPETPPVVASSEVFLLHPRNAAFFDGKEQSLRGDTPVIVAVLAVAGIALTILGLHFTWALLEGQSNWNSFITRAAADLLISAGLIALDSIVRSRHRNRRLTEAGRLLSGEIVDARARAWTLGHRLTLLYTFDSPTGVRLKARAVGPGNGSGPLPETGTAVAVVYVNDRVFQVL
jgi:hypothetical protein